MLTVLLQPQGAGFLLQTRAAHGTQLVCVGCKETAQSPQGQERSTGSAVAVPEAGLGHRRAAHRHDLIPL